jgi:DNA-binding CsgD family transcriptional regulator
MPQSAFLRAEFGLTPAEARLVLRLVEGDSLRSSANALSIGYETARTTLKSVFPKNRNVPAGGAGHHDHSCHEQDALIARRGSVCCNGRAVMKWVGISITLDGGTPASGQARG